HGTADSKPKRIVVHGTSNGVLVRLDKHTINGNGLLESSDTIDSTNKLFIKADDPKDATLTTRFGYKLVEGDNQPCIAILHIPLDASVAWGEGTKFRASKVTTVGIFRLVNHNNYLYVIPHNCRKLCDNCPCEPELEYKKCGHKFCDNCLKTFVKSVNCQICNKKIKGAKPVYKTYITQAQTCYHQAKKLIYEIGETLEEPEFVPDLSQVCVPGIHYTKLPEDVAVFIEKIPKEEKFNEYLIKISDLTEIMLTIIDTNISLENSSIKNNDSDDLSTTLLQNVADFKKTQLEKEARVPLISQDKVPIIPIGSSIISVLEKKSMISGTGDSEFEKLFEATEENITDTNFSNLFPSIQVGGKKSDKGKKPCLDQ
ncbi:MAG: hypothetical protein H0X03_07450, partial [Nitrosopumilus sp.]|nr:hypothetical protein [Nitrosopumilus sp.]